jgi:hypothetical protein
MYQIKLMDGSVKWYNERVIMIIHYNDDGTYTLEHFNNTKVIIREFTKV